MADQEHVPTTQPVPKQHVMDPATHRAVCSCGWKGPIINGLTKASAQIAALDHSKQARGVAALTQTRRTR